MLKGKGTMGLVKDDVKVELINLQEGLWGDFDPTDPADENLLRFDVSVLKDGEWSPVENASYCTFISANNSTDYLAKKLKTIMSPYYEALHNNPDAYVKRIGEELSYIC